MANMNAPKMSHTVLLANPDNAQLSAAFGALKPGFASSAGLYSTHGASAATRLTPMMPIAPPGSGSSIKPTTTPAKMAKKYNAGWGSPSGAGIRAGTAVMA